MSSLGTLLDAATPLQRRAFELLKVNPNSGPNVAISGTPGIRPNPFGDKRSLSN